MIEIWMEGYRATGGSSPAQRVGVVTIYHAVPTLKAACDAYAAAHPDWAKDYDPERLTHWGCRLFDNETDARKSFG